MTTAKGRMVLSSALAVVALGMLWIAATAGATHPRPKGATPLRVSLVPAYNSCTAPNRTHGPPLAFPSCNPPVQASSFLTVGTPDANGAVANSVGYFRMDVAPANPDTNIVLTSSISDVRCQPAMTGMCGNANTAGGGDYV